MGRNEQDELTAAQIFYPCMQCADIFFLKVLLASKILPFELCSSCATSLDSFVMEECKTLSGPNGHSLYLYRPLSSSLCNFYLLSLNNNTTTSTTNNNNNNHFLFFLDEVWKTHFCHFMQLIQLVSFL